MISRISKALKGKIGGCIIGYVFNPSFNELNDPYCSAKKMLRKSHGMRQIVMKELSVLLILIISLASSGITEDDVTCEGVVYLHCFRSSRGLSSNLDSSEATPPQRILSMRLTLDRPIDVSVSPQSKGISGVIRHREKGFFVSLTGRFGTSSHGFEGEVVLDEIFDPILEGFSGAVNPFRCVISTSKDITPFLRAQAKADAELNEENRRTRRR